MGEKIEILNGKLKYTKILSKKRKNLLSEKEKS